MSGHVRRLAAAALVASAIGMLVSSGNLAVGQQNQNRKRGKQSNNQAAARERQQQAAVKAATAQLNAAKQVLAAAESKGAGAQAKLDSALAKLREEGSRFREAQSTSRLLAKELAEIEDEILEEQSANSPYAKAKLALEAARSKMNSLEDRIMRLAATQSALAGLTGTKYVEAKTAALGVHADYLMAKNAFETEADLLAKIRSDLFQTDKDWKEASAALTQARKEESEAELMTHSGASGQVSGKATVKDSAEAAATARAAIAQAEKVIKANNDRSNNPPSKGKSPPGKNNNKKK
jgi:hypothetical protein